MGCFVQILGDHVKVEIVMCVKIQVFMLLRCNASPVQARVYCSEVDGFRYELL